MSREVGRIILSLLITKIDLEIENADAFFPKLNGAEWKLISEEKHGADEKNKWNYSFEIFERTI